jgi:hypothetical protein
MFIPTKRGGLVFAILFVCQFFAEFLTQRIFHGDRYYQNHRWPIPFTFLLAAGIVQLCLKPRNEPAAEEESWYLSRSSEIDPYTARKESAFAFTQVLRNEDALFWIPARYWPWIYCGLAVILYAFPLSGY